MVKRNPHHPGFLKIWLSVNYLQPGEVISCLFHRTLTGQEVSQQTSAAVQALQVPRTDQCNLTVIHNYIWRTYPGMEKVWIVFKKTAGAMKTTVCIFLAGWRKKLYIFKYLVNNSSTFFSVTKAVGVTQVVLPSLQLLWSLFQKQNKQHLHETTVNVKLGGFHCAPKALYAVSSVLKNNQKILHLCLPPPQCYTLWGKTSRQN